MKNSAFRTMIVTGVLLYPAEAARQWKERSQAFRQYL